MASNFSITSAHIAGEVTLDGASVNAKPWAVFDANQHGGEYMEAIKGLYPESRVLFVSRHADDQLACHGLAIQASAFCAKPFNFDELASKVRETLDAEPP